MTVTTSLPWWERSAAVLVLTAVMAFVVWWAFDFGQIFGGAHLRDVDARTAALQTEAMRLRSDASALRVGYSQLESDLAMSRGAEHALARQLAELAAENTELKEAAMALKRLVPDADRHTAARRAR